MNTRTPTKWITLLTLANTPGCYSTWARAEVWEQNVTRMAQLS